MFDSNRRKYPRANYSCELILQLDNGLNETILAVTSNIGVGGICVHLNEGIDVGTKSAIQINFKNPSTPFKCTGEIVRCMRKDKNLYNIGIQFDPLSELKFAFLDGKVAELIDLEQKGAS